MAYQAAKPFLKWAGGKTQLIGEIQKVLPDYVYKEKFMYIEPFVGSRAVLFFMLNNFHHLEKAVINDINEDLMNTYKAIASKPEELISILEDLQHEFHALEKKEEDKKNIIIKKEICLIKGKKGKLYKLLCLFFSTEPVSMDFTE